MEIPRTARRLSIKRRLRISDKELRKYGMEADLWAFDINNIYEMQNDFYDIEFVGIDAYGRAFIINREDEKNIMQSTI
ncbi:hypothetical protein [Metamycoplasma hominis]|uniref:hypothetical protein n=1 Tax=Metamycoplasma hominis TaxID=2098 RepID=UPI001E65A1AD|nr:hypothetical protein [Metamycoplasma hominis]